jgi:NADPH2:quinone reductase
MMQRLGGIHGTRPGGYQSHVRVPADTLVRLPDGLDPERAMALGLPAVTAYLALDALDTRPGHRVLVHAGSSAVGSMAIQMLAASGADVVATGTRPAKFDFMRAAGASRVVSTRDDDWWRAVAPVDRVFDLVGKSVFAASVGALAAGGRLVFVGGTSGGELTLSGWDLMKPVVITGYSSETLTRDELERAVKWIALRHAAGELRCLEVTQFPLAKAADAHRAMEAGEVAGRVMLGA